MTDTAPILVVFGIEPEGKPRASRFAEKDAELVTKAATLLGFRTAWITDEAGRALAEALPNGDVFARGNGFVRLVRQSAFDKLAAAVDGAVAAIPEKGGGLMTGKSQQGSARISALNDELRRFGRGGRIMITSGIQALGTEGVAHVLAAVAGFDAFTDNNDPYGEHDCAILTVDGRRVMFKIDYYDRDLAYHSPDPSDPTVTERVMTVMLASEY